MKILKYIVAWPACRIFYGISYIVGAFISWQYKNFKTKEVEEKMDNDEEGIFWYLPIIIYTTLLGCSVAIDEWGNTGFFDDGDDQ